MSPERHDESTRSAKRLRRDVFTPPASPEAGDSAMHVDDEADTPMFQGILDFMERCGIPSMCSREISEGLLTEGKVQLIGTTPSTVVDAAIKQHLKRCSAQGKSPHILKVNDPRYPRKTLYHLSHVDPFSEAKPRVIPDLRVIEPATPDTRRSVDRESAASDSDNEMDICETLSNDGQGPFTAPIEERKRMSLSPSPEVEFSLSTLDAKKALGTPAASEPASPKNAIASRQVNITLPPSPFVSPQQSEEDPDQESALKLPATTFTTSPLAPTRDYDPNDFTDVHVKSPEQVSLRELDSLLDF